MKLPVVKRAGSLASGKTLCAGGDLSAVLHQTAASKIDRRWIRVGRTGAFNHPATSAAPARRGGRMVTPLLHCALGAVA